MTKTNIGGPIPTTTTKELQDHGDACVGHLAFGRGVFVRKSSKQKIEHEAHRSKRLPAKHHTGHVFL